MTIATKVSPSVAANAEQQHVPTVIVTVVDPASAAAAATDFLAASTTCISWWFSEPAFFQFLPLARRQQ
ncbi:hypothetical protein DPMN_189778 [Dreissena polymorpha]|uniref:Uncharacterized protein n=1 Tax=Dreissena polymorpha TaxID=45954 RepID=A0A9D4IBC3_DREPO|nr:hypothetical protein DPMN_189778 [Dreissena polymorpha]